MLIRRLFSAHILLLFATGLAEALPGEIGLWGGRASEQLMSLFGVLLVVLYLPHFIFYLGPRKTQ